MTITEKVVKYYRNKQGIFRKCFQALEELLAIYEDWQKYCDYSSPLPVCPLCKKVPVSSKSDLRTGCDHCPWTVISGSSSCSNMSYFIRNSKRRQNRIEQLRRWIASYKKAQGIIQWRLREK